MGAVQNQCSPFPKALPWAIVLNQSPCLMIYGLPSILATELKHSNVRSANFSWRNRGRPGGGFHQWLHLFRYKDVHLRIRTDRLLHSGPRTEPA